MPEYIEQYNVYRADSMDDVPADGLASTDVNNKGLNDVEIKVVSGQNLAPNSVQDMAIRSLTANKITAGSIDVGEYIQSTGFISGGTGWRISGSGAAEFASITLTGGTFKYGKTSFTDSVNAGYIFDTNGVYIGGANDASILKFTVSSGLFQIGSWHIKDTAIASSATVATANVLIDAANSLIRLGSTSGNYITLDGANHRMQSSNYSAGVSGFSISDTLVEAENIKARGELGGVTFKVDVNSVLGGNTIVSNGDTLAVDMTAMNGATMTTNGSSSFLVNDILLIRAVASGIQEEYFRVTGISFAPTYNITRDLAGAYAPNDNPTWKAGTSIVKVGSSDGASAYSGGWLKMLGEGTNSPYYSVFARTGVAYNAWTEKVRMGNLNGFIGIVTDVYGFAAGTAGQYFKYDGTDMTVTGGTIQTSDTASTGIKMNSTALTGYDAGNNSSFELNATTGTLTAKRAYIASVYEFAAFWEDSEGQPGEGLQITCDDNENPSNYYVAGSLVDGGGDRNAVLWRLQRESYGNFSRKTVSYTIFSGNSTAQYHGVVVIGSYVYSFYKVVSTGNINGNRCPLDLSSDSSLTFDTPPPGWGANGGVCSDGTYIYFCDGAALYAYSISGTNLTYESAHNITLATSNGYWCYCDGTYIYTINSTTVYKHNLAGVQQTTQTKYLVDPSNYTDRLAGFVNCGLNLMTVHIQRFEVSSANEYIELVFRAIEI